MRIAPYQPKKARIEIVPMIDTIFFLLVFFMMASLAMTTMRGMPVNLPKAAQAQSRPVDKVVLTLTADGRYYVDREPVTFEQIRPALREVLRRNPDTAVVINCDQNQRVKGLVELADEAKSCGARLLTIATSPKEEGGS
ncbi:MAG: biopolymer transporter ExbD [Armatimonadota bacterium]|nr:MAG: biopolymer transporter ExbD [Armatimonadota bacterium]